MKTLHQQLESEMQTVYASTEDVQQMLDSCNEAPGPELMKNIEGALRSGLTALERYRNLLGAP